MEYKVGDKFTKKQFTEELINFCNENGFMLLDIDEGEHKYELAKIPEETIDKKRARLRRLREYVCFRRLATYCPFYFDKLTSEQKEELKQWYQAWLDAPQTLVEPTAPEWFN